jgi:putative PIN family toxin of toxin-antitoxin system
MDNSTLVSAALRPDSLPHRVLLTAVRQYEVCASTDTLSELNEVLARPKFNQYLDVDTRSEFMSLVHESFRRFSVPSFTAGELAPSCRDASDNKFLALALTAQAGIIVSSDDDLLVLNPWRGISIVTPADFLTRSQSATESPENE